LNSLYRVYYLCGNSEILLVQAKPIIRTPISSKTGITCAPSTHRPGKMNKSGGQIDQSFKLNLEAWRGQGTKSKKPGRGEARV
jgi:hypothetical protein